MHKTTLKRTTWRIAARVPTLGSAILNGLFYFSWGTGPLMGWIFALTMAAADLMKPEVVSFAARGGRSRRTVAGLAAAVLIALSLLAATGEFMGGRAATVSTTEQARIEFAAAKQSYDSLAETLTAEALEILEADKRAAAEREGARGYCGPDCESLKSEASELTRRLGEARAKADALRRMDAAKAHMKEDEAFAETLARELGVSTYLVMMLLSLLAAAGIEIAAAFGPLMIEERLAPPRPQSADGEPAQMTIEDFVMLAVAQAGGRAKLSNKAIAQRFSISESTASRAVTSLADDGLIRISQDGRQRVIETV